MAREYQQIKKKEFVLPFTVYMQTLWCIRDYSRLKQVDDLQARLKTEAIDDAFDLIPISYRKGLRDNIIFHSQYGEFAHENTWKQWKQRLVYYAANNLGFNVGGEDDE